MPADPLAQPVAAWIDLLFKVKLSKNKYLKDKVSSLLRNGVVATKTFIAPGRRTKTILIPESERVTLYNAVLLNGFIDDTAKVRRIFEEAGYRYEVASLLAELFATHTELPQLKIDHIALDNFFSTLRSDGDLKTVLLPNPFSMLPQTVMDQGVSLLQYLLLGGVILNKAEAMAAHYLNGDIEQAYEYAACFEATSEIAEQFRLKIIAEYKQAVHFQKNFAFLMN